MQNSSQRRRAYNGPVFYSHGFRSFFMFAGVWAWLAMLVWVLFLSIGHAIPSRMEGVDWHMHEMVFGYSSAVIAGFLLTAVPNWTGRMPIIGWPTAALSGLWLLGRAAIFFSAHLPPLIAPVIDSSFLIVLAVVLAREIMAGKNWRNMKVLVVLSVLALANILFHVEVAMGGAFGGYGIRLGVGTVIFLISLIGGRVIPSFTRNWMARRGPGRLPVPFNRFDKVVLAVTGLTLLVWVAFPDAVALRILALLAGIFHLVRLWRWVGWRSFAEPLVLVLHVAYFFIPLGFVMLSLGDALPWTARVPHAWVAGAVGMVTLAMMTRASLGHSGRPLAATWRISMIYILVALAALTRIVAELLPWDDTLLIASGVTWIAGFAWYTVVYFPILTKPRLK